MQKCRVQTFLHSIYCTFLRRRAAAVLIENFCFWAADTRIYWVGGAVGRTPPHSSLRRPKMSVDDKSMWIFDRAENCTLCVKIWTYTYILLAKLSTRYLSICLLLLRVSVVISHSVFENGTLDSYQNIRAFCSKSQQELEKRFAFPSRCGDLFPLKLVHWPCLACQARQLEIRSIDFFF